MAIRGGYSAFSDGPAMDPTPHTDMSQIPVMSSSIPDMTPDFSSANDSAYSGLSNYGMPAANDDDGDSMDMSTDALHPAHFQASTSVLGRYARQAAETKKPKEAASVSAPVAKDASVPESRPDGPNLHRKHTIHEGLAKEAADKSPARAAGAKFIKAAQGKDEAVDATETHPRGTGKPAIYAGTPGGKHPDHEANFEKHLNSITQAASEKRPMSTREGVLTKAKTMNTENLPKE
jgi:hypothetical protein